MQVSVAPRTETEFNELRILIENDLSEEATKQSE